MAQKLTMRLIVDGQEKQKLKADLDPKNSAIGINTPIFGAPIITGENHLNPRGIRDVQTAYMCFEAIRNDEYNKKGQKTTIELAYE